MEPQDLAVVEKSDEAPQALGSRPEGTVAADDDLNTGDEAVATVQSRELYPQLNGVFKTINRLLDDVVMDLEFLNDETNPRGILQAHPLEYSEQLSQIKYNKYEVRFLNETTPLASPVEYRKSLSNGEDMVTIIRALLYTNSEPSLSRTRVYHLRIVVKTRHDEKPVSKNEFHLAQLSPEDEIDMIESALVKETDQQVVRDSLPKLLDSASYVCALTKKAVRFEISAPEFDHEDLHEFEIGPINVRHRKAFDKYPDVSENPPSPAQCLHTLFKALRVPLLSEPTDDIKSIPAENKSLNISINPSILLKKMHFELNHNEYFPPNISNRDDRKSNIIREAFIRQITEIILLGTKAYSQGAANPFAHHRFSKNFDLVFHALQDNASTLHHKEVLKDKFFIDLSAFPFYSDDLLITCYKKTLECDQQNAMVYYDSLKEIQQRKATLKLSHFVRELHLSGVIGYSDLENAYKHLNIDPVQAPHIDDELLLTMYKNETSMNPSDSTLRESMMLIARQRGSSKLEHYLKYEPLPLEKAYEVLDIDHSVDDDIVATAVLIKKGDSPEEEELLNRAFLTIAVNRKSFLLLNEAERDFPDLNEQMDFKEACEYLGADENADEIQCINIFQLGQREIKTARYALRVIGQKWNSGLTDSFLKTGLIDQNSLPPSEWPVGLDNIGNTCYLNSLLQYYFSIKPLRDTILSFDEVFEEDSDIYKLRRIGGRLVDDNEIERSFQFIYQLRDLFYELIHTKNRCIQPTRELAFLAFLPSYLKVEFEKDGEVNDNNVVIIDENTSKDLIDLTNSSDDIVMVDAEPQQKSDELAQPPDLANVPDEDQDKSVINDTITGADTACHKTGGSSLKAARISDSEIENAYEIGRQQDVTECIGNVLSQIEAAMKPDALDETDNEQIDFVKKLFYGNTVAHLVNPSDTAIRRETTDKFSNLYANVMDHPRHLYEAIDNAFASEEVSTGGETLTRTERITHLPTILQIQIQRVYYDKQLCRPYKDISPLPFPETLYMDRYLDTDDPEIIKKRAEVVEWKSELAALKRRKDKLLKKNTYGLTYKDALKSLLQWTDDEDLCKKETRVSIQAIIDKIDVELSSIYTKTQELQKKIDTQFDNYQKYGYSIFAIFIHRGEASYGHYWIYIKDRKKNVYRKYNDDQVTEVAISDVLNFNEGNTATPYFLAYVKNTEEETIVDPLHRIVDE